MKKFVEANFEVMYLEKINYRIKALKKVQYIFVLPISIRIMKKNRKVKCTFYRKLLTKKFKVQLY